MVHERERAWPLAACELRTHQHGECDLCRARQSRQPLDHQRRGNGPEPGDAGDIEELCRRELLLQRVALEREAAKIDWHLLEGSCQAIERGQKRLLIWVESKIH